MESPDSGLEPQGKRLHEAKDEFVDEQAGNYASNLDYVLNHWIQWTPSDITALEDVDALTMREYSLHLKDRVEAKQSGDTGISATTAKTYYANVSALLAWGVEVEIIDENPAKRRKAKKPLPNGSTNSSDQQFWTAEQRTAIVEYVDERAREAINSDEVDAYAPIRDRAFITTLAYTGVRASEILADPTDDRRTGLRWNDVDLETGVIEVLGKGTQDIEPVGLPAQTIAPLERLETVVDCPDDSWPVFPTRHAPTLYAEIEAAEHDRPDGDPWSYMVETGIEPPALTVSGGRSILKRLSSDADIPGLEIDDGEYLTLHGARRGVGEAVFDKGGAQQAQRTLRHQDPSTTTSMYAHKPVADLAGENTTVFDDE